MKTMPKPLLFATITFSILTTALSGWAQDDLFITVSAPAENTESPFKTVSAPAAAPVSAPSAQSAVPEKPVELPALSVNQTASKELGKPAPAGKWEQELLRDPFWPIGFFPADWKKASTAEGAAGLEGSGWKAASGKLRISGTSQLGGRTVAIIGGELKSAGDIVDVVYEGQTYQWQIVGIEANGQVQLKKLGIK
jgi:hypothetical protein